MQNRYFGDVGDYGKYELLRQIASPNISSYPLMLEVNWYLVPDECHNKDGRHISYLENDKMRPCDPELFDSLCKSLENGARNIRVLEKGDVLPSSTQFFSEPFSYDDLPAIGARAKEQHLKRRSAWSREGLQATSNSDLVFFDPDNGLEIASKKKHEINGPQTYLLGRNRSVSNQGAIRRHLSSAGSHRRITHAANQNQGRPSSAKPIIWLQLFCAAVF